MHETPGIHCETKGFRNGRREFIERHSLPTKCSLYYLKCLAY